MRLRTGATRAPGYLAVCALSAALLGALLLPSLGAAEETAAEAAKKPVQPPKPRRLPDGHLNWTGFWAPVTGMLQVNIGLGGSVPGDTSNDIRPFMKYSELKSPYKEQLQQFMQAAMKGKVDDPVAKCFPPGMPRMMVMVYGMEFLQTPGQITITSEWQAASRRIWLNQKTHTSPDELDPTYTGESLGHWEGDKLIVDTIGIRTDVPANYFGLPHTDKLHVVEVWTELKPGILQDAITVDDPDVFVAPWSEVETFRYRPDLRLREFECLENNRNVGSDGEAVFKN